MNEEKKMMTKRLILFIFLSYLLVWGMNGITTACGVKYEDAATQLILSLAMLCPTIAMLFTRLLTKQGFAGMGFGISLKGKWKYYIMAVLVPWFYAEAGKLLYYILVKGSGDFSFPGFAELPKSIWWLIPVNGLISSLLYSFGGLGEEAGWRGYMYPMLEKLMGNKAGPVMGGIIWAVWHFPMIAMGHNFGTGYPGYPWMGFTVFTVYCIGTGFWLDFLTKRTGSVWPAAFAHAANNNMTNVCFLQGAMVISESALFVKNAPAAMAIMMIPQVVIGVVCWVIILKEERKAKQEQTEE